MSRVAKMPVVVPAGVDVSVKDGQINVKGAGGALALAQNALVNVVIENGKVTFAPANDSREADAMSGTLRQLVNNMVLGVSKGFEKKLTLVGVGYKAQAQGNKLNLSVGFSPRPRRPKSSSKALTVSVSVRWRPTSDRFVPLSPTRARASAMRTRRS